MEPAQIDWKRIDSRFVEDIFYEHLRAPKWFDFLSPNNHLQDSSIEDDDAWFCKPDCNHPKRPEDFLLTPNSSKTPGGVTEQNQRIRGHVLSEDSENHNPNLATPPPPPPSQQQANKSWRAALKSTSVKKMNKETPKLKSTQSARNLFSGRDILGHISEFCYELKRLATRGVTEREDTTTVKETHHQVHDLDLKKERKPLLEVSKDKDKVLESTDAKGITFNKEIRRRKKRVDDAENIPLSLNVVKLKEEQCRRKKPVVDAENIPPPTPLKLGNIKNKGHERLLQQIRTNPPSPQCFSENRTASLNALMTIKPTVENEKETAEEEKSRDSMNKEGGGRVLEVLWFLKPCSMAN
ncbi:Uncharacterized protein Rs2_18529 [Raphanus sativus]|uniref:Uncharacterized protein LOC108832720 n=1 Tax=Raphanus sativus TaxID=3726 RepID=A0A6J0LPE9_RAPSA|nr:uncharacterized protein LOC108832720 [Raphanus sativus]KAJ4904578.1 Uncharacterized protein Rs2_18529 [Raphanus sativus]